VASLQIWEVSSDAADGAAEVFCRGSQTVKLI
jgi:hypothetical protein